MRTFLYLVVAFWIVSCSEQEVSTTTLELSADTRSLEATDFEKYVVVGDARVSSLSSTTYVRQLVLVNMSDNYVLPTTLTFQGVSFFDDGSINDEVSGDGIYTTAEVFTHDASVLYNSESLVRSVMPNQIMIDSAFIGSETLLADIDLTSAKLPGSQNGPVATLTCDIEFGTCGCRADRWGWCDCCCFTVSNCEGTIGWG